MRRGPAPALVIALAASTSAPLSARDRSAAELYAAGDYVGVASDASVQVATGQDRVAVAERWLMAAVANEREEGRTSDTEAALAASVAAFSKDAPPPAVGARVAGTRSLMLSRAGRFEDAARTILEAHARLALARGTEEFLELNLAYGVILIRMALASRAVGIIANIADARLSLPNGDPRLLETLHWLGVAQLRSGERVDAAGTLREVLRVRTLTLGASHPDTLATRSMLASAIVAGAPAEAASERREILVAWEGRGDARDSARIAEAMLNVSMGLQSAADRLATLRAAYGKARTATPPIARITAETAVALAKALVADGRVGEALDTLTDAAAASEEFATTHLGDDLQVTRAVIYTQLDRGEEAEAVYRRLIAAYDADLGRSRADRLTLLNNLAGLLAARGKFDQAIPIAREVAVGRERLLGAIAPLTLSAKSSLASYLSQIGHPVESLKLHREVLAARLGAEPSDDQALARSYHNVAATLDDAKLYPETLGFAERAVALRIRVLGPDHPDTIDSVRQLAGLRFSTGDYDGATKAYRVAVASLERTRLVSTTGDRQRRAWFARYAQVYKMLAMLEARAGNPSALAYADAARGRTLWELTGSREAVEAAATPEDAAALQAARAAVGVIVAEDASALDGPGRARHSAALDVATARLAALEKQLAARYPALRFSTSAAPLERSRIRQAIGAGSSLITFVNLGDKVLRITIAPDDAVEADQRDVPGLEETVRSYLALLSSKALAGTVADPLADRAVYAWPDGSYRLLRFDQEVPEAATIVGDVEIVRKALSEALLGDLPQSVRQSPRWIVSPDGPLAAMPIDSLEVDGRMIVERTAVSYTPSIRMLLSLRDQRAAYQSLDRQPMLVIGAPSFSTAPAGSPLRAWAELPGSAAEVASLRVRFGLTEGTNLFSASTATEQHLRALDASGQLGRYRTVVLSTHGLIDVADVERNAVLLLGDGSSGASDGYIRAAELMSLRMRADLIVVSACQSGVGEWLDGEGAMGLPFALLAAGGSSAMLSHWSIADKSSAAFVGRFFAKLQDGDRAAQALWHTKQDFAAGREGERWRDPAYWAAFDLYGAD